VSPAGVLASDYPADGVLRLQLNRPERRNALDRGLVRALLGAFESPDCAAIVLSSTDPAAFCSGADVSLEDAERTEVSDLLYTLYERMISVPAPIVVAVGGHAVGGGVQLAIAGDVRIAGPAASFRFAGAGHGLAVAAWGLPSLVGRGRTLDLCLTMREVVAAEALEIGLVDRIEPAPEEAAVDLATAFARLAPEAAAKVKRVAAEATGLHAALNLERTGNRSWSGSMTRPEPPR
jgi:enoyl-CoA hydratase/carnithine racemase